MSKLVNSSFLYKIITTALLLCVLDVIATVIGLNMGLTEANPLSNFSFPFFAFKFGIWLLQFPLVYTFNKKRSVFGLFVVSLVSISGLCMYIFAVSLNFTLILGGIL